MSEINKNENLTCKVKVFRQIYPRTKIESGDWGILSCSLVEVIDGEPTLDKNECLVVKGVLPEINLYDTYKLIGKLVWDEAHGWQYDIVYFNSDYNLTDRDEQRIFLSHILTDLQLSELYKTFPNPFEIIDKEDIQSLTKVKGIGAFTAQKIIDRYIDNKDYSKIFVELHDYGLTQNVINKLLEKYCSPDIIVQKIKQNPYILAKDIEGIGWKKADSVALKAGMDKHSDYRIEAYINHYLLEQSEKGHSWAYPSDILFAVEEMLEEDVDENQFKSILYLMYEKGVLYWDDSKSFICLKEFYELENNIKEELLRLLRSENKFEYSNYELVVSTLEKYQGWEYTIEQKNAIRLALDNNVSIITGSAGTGKSATVKAIITVLKEYEFAQTALAGRAASRLTEMTGDQGYTIHKLLEYNPKIGGFGYDADNQLPHDIIILDETSMVGGELFYQLIQAIKDGAKLIMLGDIGQLEAIGLANIFKDLIDSGIIPVAKLPKIHRQAQKSAIITNSVAVREGNQITKQGWTGIEVRGELRDLIVDIYDERLFTAKKIMEWFKSEYEQLNNIMDIQIIVPVKEKGDACTFELNNEIQEYYNPYKMGKSQVDITKNKKTYTLRVNDKVINVKNSYKTINENGENIPIFNGYIGIIKSIEENYMIVDFDSCGKILIKKKQWGNIELAYAITGHKFQGSQNNTIIVGLDYNSYSLLTKEWVYTALTRAQKKCILCAENAALRFAISNSNITTKQTFLKKMLQENNQISP
jgi:exodeoxyribonuclease V alpha subunit